MQIRVFRFQTGAIRSQVSFKRFLLIRSFDSKLVRLEGLLQFAVSIGNASFDSKLVRLEVVQKKNPGKTWYGFDSKLVRLEDIISI